MADDKLTLRASQAGMRFIAQMTIYNSGDFDRLRTYIAESYHPLMLAEHSAEAWLDQFREWGQDAGKVKVQQVLGASKHQVVVLLASERVEDFWLCDLTVEEEYPHRIISYSVTVME